MRGIVIALLLAASTAHAQSIFPAGGEVPSTPTIWISATEMPAITVRSKGAPVMYEVDEMHVSGGIHRIAITPQVTIDEEFTVTAGRTTAKFKTIDGDAHGEAARYNQIEFHVESISIADNALVVDAIVKRGAIMYLLDQNRDYAADSEYLWIGEGKDRGGDKPELPGGSPFPASHRRFVIPLSAFGASCASQKTIEFSPYVQQMTGGATLYPIARMQIDHGKVRMPLELVDRFEKSDELDAREWVSCFGAKVAGAKLEATLMQEPVPVPMRDESQLYCEHVGKPWVRMDAEATNQNPPEPASDDTVAYIQVIVVLFGALLVMWRATAKIG